MALEITVVLVAYIILVAPLCVAGAVIELVLKHKNKPDPAANRDEPNT